MSSSQQQVQLMHFGKLPGRGDFVRSATHTGLVQIFDRWFSGALDLLAADARWKELYDGAEPLHFAVLGPRRPHVVAGHIRPSADGSGRRFPFLVAGMLEVDDPASFMGRAPLALNRLWTQCDQWARRAQQEADPTSVLAALGQHRVEVNTAAAAYDAPTADFTDMQTVGSAQALLNHAAREVDFARCVLGLGVLLQPVPASGSARLDTGVRLPLPMDPLYRPYMASWWLDLVRGFLARADFEVLLLLPQSPEAPASIAIGFAGGSAPALAAYLGRRPQEAPYVDLLNPEWADESAQQDPAVRKLASYLQQQGLSLAQVGRTFREAFLGE